MAKILVLYYSSYGHIEQMAEAIAEGARSVVGTDVTVKRVPELVPEEVARTAGMRIDQDAPIASPGTWRRLRLNQPITERVIFGNEMADAGADITEMTQIPEFPSYRNSAL